MSEYRQPKQSRAVSSEDAFLDTLASLLTEHSFYQLTVAMITQHAGLSHGAFMGRFGSKRSAVSRLFARFCDDVDISLEQLVLSLNGDEKLISVFSKASSVYEQLVRRHLGVNRAMQELFLSEKEIDEQTKAIFKKTVATFLDVYDALAIERPDLPAMYSAVQVMVTYNYNYVIGAMPASPADPKTRHTQIAQSMLGYLKKD